MEPIKEENKLVGRYTSDGNYDPRFIEQVVKEVQEGLPQKAALVKYCLKKGTLQYWLYGGNYSFKPSKAPSASAATKRSVLRAIREGRMSIKEAVTACKLKSARTIYDWREWEKKENAELGTSNPDAMGKKKIDKQDRDGHPSQEELAALRQALADEQLKNAALNTLIDVAEEQLKINIRKKPGARQS